MADNPNSIGDIVVTITGDAEPLQGFLNLAENLADGANERMSESFGKTTDAANKTGTALGALKDTFGDIAAEEEDFTNSTGQAAASLLKVGSAAQDVLLKQQALEAQVRTAQTAYDELRKGYDNGTVSAATLARAQDDLASAITKANPQLATMTPGLQQAGAASETTALGFMDIVAAMAGFAGIELGAKALLGFAEDALETYANIQKATIAIDALTGGVGKATGIVQELAGLAIQDALSFPTLLTAEQRMLAFGISSNQIPGILRALADSAAATNKDIGAVSNAFDRIIESGNLSGRTLVQLGLSMKDVASAMGVTESSARTAFQALDQSDKIQVLEAALSKFEGTAAQVAQSLAGQWQILKTQADLTFAGIGELLAPIASQLLQFASSTIQSVDVVVKSYIDLKNSASELIGTVSSVENSIIQAVTPAYDLAKSVASATASAIDFADAGRNASESSKEWAGEFGTLGSSSHASAAEIAFAITPVGQLKQALDEARDVIELVTGAVPKMGKTMEELVGSVAKATTASIQFKNAWDLSQMAAGFVPFTSGMATVIKQQDEAQQKYQQAKIAYDGLNQSLQTGTAMQNGQIATQEQVNRAYATEQAALKALDTTTVGHIQTADQLEHKDAELKDAVDKARQSYADESAAMARGEGSATALKAAKDQLTAAEKAAHEANAAGILSLDDLISKNNDLNAALRVAQGVYDQVTARVKAGSGEYNLQSEALKQLTKVHKDLGDAETSVDVIIATSISKNQDLTDKITAQMQAYEKLDEEYGKDNLLTVAAQQEFEKLAKQVGLTAIQFEALISESDKTGESIIELVNKDGAVASAFKDLGVTSTAQFEQMAQTAKDAFETISADSKSSSGDVYESLVKEQNAIKALRDSTDGMKAAFHDLGITSSQDIRDMGDKMATAYDHIRDVGTASFGDLQKASDALRENQWQLHQSMSGLEDDFKALGLTSSAQLQHMASEAEIMYNRIVGSGQSSSGDIARAHDAMTKAAEKYHDSLVPIDNMHKQIGASSQSMATQSVSSFSFMMEAITNTNQAMQDLGLITVEDISSVEGLARAFSDVATSAESAASAAKSIGDSSGSFTSPSPFGGSGSQGFGSFQTGTTPGTYQVNTTMGSLGSGKTTINENYTPISTGFSSAQDEVDHWMSKGYSFADAKSKAHFDGWDVSGVVDKSAKGSSGAGGSASIGGGAASSQKALEDAAAAYSKALQSGDQAAITATQVAYNKSLNPASSSSTASSANLPNGVTPDMMALLLSMGYSMDEISHATVSQGPPVLAPLSPGSQMGMSSPQQQATPSVPGLSSQDVAAFLAQGLTLGQISSGLVSHGSTPQAGMSSPETQATPSVPGLSTAEVQQFLAQGLTLGQIQSGLVSHGSSVPQMGMSAQTPASTAPTSNYTGAGLTLDQVRALQGVPIQAAPVAVPQKPDISTLQFSGGLSPTSTLPVGSVSAQQAPQAMSAADIWAALGITPPAATPVASVAPLSTPAATTPIASPTPAVTAPIAPALGTESSTSSAASMNITAATCNLTVTGSLNGSGGTVINVYATVSSQSMSDTLVASLQNMGNITGKV